MCVFVLNCSGESVAADLIKLARFSLYIDELTCLLLRNGPCYRYENKFFETFFPLDFWRDRKAVLKELL